MQISHQNRIGGGRRARGWIPGCAVAAWLALAPSASAGPCDAWPGEPQPLPTVTDGDPPRARWAELRATELTQLASRLEATAPIEAYLLWRRVLCLDPKRAAARSGAARTRPIRSHRPAVVGTPRSVAVDAASGEAVQALLDAPVAVGPPVRPPPPMDRDTERQIILASIDAALATGEEDARHARFEAALASAQAVRPRLERMRRLSDLPERWVRVEVLAATAQLALGNDDAAAASLARAIAAQPDLELDPQHTPPKLLRALATARAAAEPSP